MFRKVFGNSAPASTPPDEITFTVLDVETTGLFPQKHDRIIEVAIVRLNGNGDSLGEFVTLINPERDIGPTRIHGISSRDVVDAPVFGEIAGDIATRIAGTVWVAHNARFDCGFLSAEFARLGYELPQAPAACTLHLARTVHASLSSYKLGELCEQLGIPHEHSHTALGDARATAALFKALLPPVWATQGGSLADLGCDPTTMPPDSSWPRLEPSGKRRDRTSGARQEEPSFLSGLVSRLTIARSTSSADAVQYTDLLNRALEDRRVTAEEAELLLETATRWGLAQDEVLLLHHDYLTSLVALARQDGIVTELELSDLREVSGLLGFKPSYADQLISGPVGPHPDRQRRVSQFTGLSVCFTGESICTRGGLPIQRSEAEQLAERAGLVPQASVTKKLDILVLADPDSLSGKAQKARRYGTRLIAEPVFWREIGVTID